MAIYDNSVMDGLHGWILVIESHPSVLSQTKMRTAVVGQTLIYAFLFVFIFA